MILLRDSKSSICVVESWLDSSSIIVPIFKVYEILRASAYLSSSKNFNWHIVPIRGVNDEPN
jgi:hypothetical protein